MRHLSALFLFIFLTSISSYAAETGKQKFQARTYVGSDSCEQALLRFEAPEGRKELALIVGAFISGSNFARNRNSQIEVKNMLAVTHAFCKRNPQKPLIVALANLDRVITRQILLSREKTKAQ